MTKGNDQFLSILSYYSCKRKDFLWNHLQGISQITRKTCGRERFSFNVFIDVSQQVYSFCRQTKLVKTVCYLVKCFSPSGLFCYFLTKIPTTKVFSAKESTRTLAVSIDWVEERKSLRERSQKLSPTIFLTHKQSAQCCLKESLIIECINPSCYTSWKTMLLSCPREKLLKCKSMHMIYNIYTCEFQLEATMILSDARNSYLN